MSDNKDRSNAVKLLEEISILENYIVVMLKVSSDTSSERCSSVAVDSIIDNIKQKIQCISALISELYTANVNIKIKTSNKELEGTTLVSSLISLLVTRLILNTSISVTSRVDLLVDVLNKIEDVDTSLTIQNIIRMLDSDING